MKKVYSSLRVQLNQIVIDYDNNNKTNKER